MPFINGKYVPADKTDRELSTENIVMPEMDEQQAVDFLIAKERKKNSPKKLAARLYGKNLLTVFLIACIIIMLFGAAASNAAIVVACLALMLIGGITYYLI